MNKAKRLSMSLVTLVLLCICLCVTSFALGYTFYQVEDNYFHTGTIGIDLNGGKAIIDEGKFEPGVTFDKPFYISNVGSGAVYYKLQFSNVSGELKDILEISVLDKNKTILQEGKMTSFELEGSLEVGERQDLIMRFHYPEEEGNRGQGEILTFEVSAIAVQTKNNPNKEFE